MSTILAIDPGYDRCGVALIETTKPSTLIASQCIETNKNDLHEYRLASIYRTVERLIEEWKPTHIALETIFFSVNKKTVIKVAEARGIIALLAGMHNIPLIELSPQEVKQGITGVGNADKKQVQKMVALTLKIDVQGKIDDELDAIALGFAATERLRVQAFEKR